MTVVVQRVEVQLQQDQLHSMVAFADRATIWSLRSKYAVYRPAGWRSDPHSSVSWRYLFFTKLDTVNCHSFNCLHACINASLAVSVLWFCWYSMQELNDVRLLCRRLWRYAIEAVLLDVKKSARWLSFEEMSKWQQQRRQYEKLHLRRLDILRRAQEPEEVGADIASLCSWY